MTETLGTNPTSPKEGVSNKEIPINSLASGILSIPDQTKRVETTRIALHYLLKYGRMVDSVDLLESIKAEKLPFHEGERNIILKSILDTAENQWREDPSDAYVATDNIRYCMERRGGEDQITLLTKEEWGKFDREAFANTSAIVTGRLIECLLNPNLPRGRYKKVFDRLNIGNIVGEADERGYFDRIYNSLPLGVRQQLDSYISYDIKKKLEGTPTTGPANSPASAAEMLRKEMEAAAARMRQPESMRTETVAEEFARELASLRELFAVPSPAQGKITAPPADFQPGQKEKTAEEMEEIGEVYRFENEAIGWQHGDYEIKIRKYDDHWTILFDVSSRYVDELLLPPENFDLATVLKEFEDKGLKPDATEKIYQALAKSFLSGLEKKEQIFLDLLKKFPDISAISPDGKEVIITATWLWGQSDELAYVYKNTYERLSKDEKGKLETIRSLNVSIGKAVLEAWIKGERAGKNINPAEPRETTTGENIINMEYIGPADFPKELNELLSLNKNRHYLTVSFSPDQLKEYIISIAKGKVQGGTVKAGTNNNIIIEGIQINMPVGGKVTLNLIIENRDPGYSFSRISADIQEYKGNWITNKFRRQVEDNIRDIDSAVKEHLDKMMSLDNSLWFAKNISISEGKFLVRFEKTA